MTTRAQQQHAVGAIHTLLTPAAKVGREIANRKGALTYSELADLCNSYLTGQGSSIRVTESRLTKLAEAYKSPSATGIAKGVDPEEAAAIAHVLHFSLDSVFGLGSPFAPNIWDPIWDSRQAAELFAELARCEQTASQLIGWAEFLPCSLETPEFMRMHHARIFLDHPTADQGKRAKLINGYNEFGDRRRHKLLNTPRTYDFAHLMLLTDVEHIAFGTDKYRGIPPATRRACLESLIRTIYDQDKRVFLVMATEADLQNGRYLHDFDSVFVIDDAITVWRSHCGTLSWTTERSRVALHRAILELFKDNATYKTNVKVVEELQAILQDERTWQK